MSDTSEKIIELTPLHTYELRRTPIKSSPSSFSSSVSSTTLSTRILSVYKLSPDRSRPNPKIPPTPDFYIDTAAKSTWATWPMSIPQTISSFPNTTSLSSISKRTVEPQNVATQTHAPFGRFMCTISSIREAPSNAQNSKMEDNTLPREIWIGSGLGHGKWYDSLLEEALAIPPKEKNNLGSMAQVKWSAYGEDWDTYVDRTRKNYSWEGHGLVSGGGLLLKAQGEVVAMYKPRCARWRDGDGEDVGTGVLGVLKEGWSEEVVMHVLLSAVGIEEQIMKSKGFAPGAYHGCWT